MNTWLDKSISIARIVLMITVLAMCQFSNAQDARTTPSLIGERVSSARQLAKLADAEFVVGIFYIAEANWRPELRPETIYLQSPQPKIAKPTILAAWTYQKAKAGQRIVTMPDLRGRKAGECESMLKLLGITIMKSEGTKSDDSIIDQYPKANQRVFEGTSALISAR